MFTVPIALYYLFSRIQPIYEGLLFSHLELHSRQTWGVIGAVIGVLTIKVHYIYRIFTDPEGVENDLIYDNEEIKDEKKVETSTQKKDK